MSKALNVTRSHAASDQPLLNVVGLRKRYGQRVVVKDISLHLNAGEVVGLLGPNGAGKTTTFYLIVGLIGADFGRIEIEGQDVSALPIHRRARMGMSYLLQEPSVFRRLTVAENIMAVLELQSGLHGQKKLSRTERKEQLEELLEELQITHVRNTLAVSLSGGERRRVELARALATKPSFVLLDEPFAGVDPIAVGEILRIIRYLKGRGMGVMITDHNVRETLGICDRTYVISDGLVLASGNPAQIIQNDQVRSVFLGENFSL